MFTPISWLSNMGPDPSPPPFHFLFHSLLSLSAVTAKAQRKFAEDHTHIRMKEILHQDLGGGSAGFEGPFGAKTV